MITTLVVEALVCPYCEAHVRDGLLGVDGVESVETRLDDGRVDVWYDEAETTIEEISDAVEDLGYKVID